MTVVRLERKKRFSGASFCYNYYYIYDHYYYNYDYYYYKYYYDNHYNNFHYKYYYNNHNDNVYDNHYHYKYHYYNNHNDYVYDNHYHYKYHYYNNHNDYVYDNHNHNMQFPDLRGLLCHSDADGFLGAAIPNGCDFIMVDVPLLPPQRHPLYSYMTTIKFTSATLEGRIVQHVNTARDTPLLLVVERSVLRSTAFSPQAVIRGVLQKVVDMKGHGVVLSDHEIADADTADIVSDSQTLSDEVQSHHGIIRYDVFFGNRSALRNLMLDVARKPSVTFVYRMSGISRTFTHLYFDNFYSIRMKEENLSSVIDRDLIQPMRRHVGSKSIAIAMTLMAKQCPKNSVITFHNHNNCVDIPLNLTRLCAMPPAYLQCHHHSAMTRHYADNNNVEADVFFEVEATFSSKVYLIMAQMKTAGLLPAAFIVERYDLDTPSEIRFYDADTGRDVECAATPFGFTKTTKEKLDVLINTP
ncbi:uncharacterized protein LOC142765553 [Rhipicephalus microplus]|uniref:uncharacterized protein LOC142765553 n=1 Tax=Rhipicephalus microplus TaxID=6941 RepID=UPI003F6CA842